MFYPTEKPQFLMYVLRVAQVVCNKLLLATIVSIQRLPDSAQATDLTLKQHELV